MATKLFHIDPMKLRAARGERSQVEVAKASGLTQGGYSRIESGEQIAPSVPTAMWIAKALGVKLEDILVMKGRR